VAVIGAGMSGILSAIRLRERGFGCVVFEKADRVGGTWRENTYPGLSCDVPAHSYTYTFARNPEWSRWYAEGAEIQRYFERVAHDYDVLRHVRFGDEVVRLAFVDGRWHVVTAAGHRDVFDVVIAATGVLHHPNLPHFNGIESFAGACFHSARWDHSVALDGERVGVIGTGSTAVQITSALVPRARRFELFQRTAQWVLPAPNPRYSDEEKAAFRADPVAFEQFIQRLHQSVNDRTAAAVIDIDSPELAEVERLCKENLETVRDPDLRRRLTPGYRAMCKRLVISPDFYDAIQKPNARLVTDRIERIEPGGVRTADGTLHELDVLVLATGFRADRFIRPAVVVGRNGRAR
jgi:cation diffusion facilitator CzcD-associated flavoprotein CzcO